MKLSLFLVILAVACAKVDPATYIYPCVGCFHDSEGYCQHDFDGSCYGFVPSAPSCTPGSSPCRRVAPVGGICDGMNMCGRWCQVVADVVYTPTVNAGDYSPCGSSNSLPCTSGYYCATSGLSAPTAQCPAGHYCPSGSIAPVICPANHKCPTPGLSAPIACTGGSIQPNEGKLECWPKKWCGLVCTNAGTASESCVPAAAGWYSPCGSADPYAALPGYTAIGGTTDMTPTPPGSFAATAYMTAPTPCPVNHKCPQSAMAAPEPCGDGMYQPTAGSTACIVDPNAPIETSSDSVADPSETSSSSSVADPSETSSDSVADPSETSSDSTTPLPCVGLDMCGKKCLADGISAEDTVVGTYSPCNSVEELPCPRGSFCDATGMSTPVPCTVDHACPTEGMSAPTPCAANYEQPSAGKAGCYPKTPICTGCNVGTAGSCQHDNSGDDSCMVFSIYEAGDVCPPGSSRCDPVDCKVSTWNQWSQCSATCGGGTQWRSRNMIVSPKHVGEPCPALVDVRPCNEEACPNPVCGDCWPGTSGECVSDIGVCYDMMAAPFNICPGNTVRCSGGGDVHHPKDDIDGDAAGQCINCWPGTDGMCKDTQSGQCFPFYTGTTTCPGSTVRCSVTPDTGSMESYSLALPADAAAKSDTVIRKALATITSTTPDFVSVARVGSAVTATIAAPTRSSVTVTSLEASIKTAEADGTLSAALEMENSAASSASSSGAAPMGTPAEAAGGANFMLLGGIVIAALAVTSGVGVVVVVSRRRRARAAATATVEKTVLMTTIV